MRRVTVWNQIFLVGFKWELTGGRSHRDILQDARSRLEHDRYVFVPPVWGSIDVHGQKGRLFALAPLLVRPEESSVSVYKLMDADSLRPFWWVMAFHNGTLSARSDRDFEKEEDALLFAESLQSTLGVEELERFDEEESQSIIREALDTADKALRKRLPAHLSRDVTPIRVMAMVAGVALFVGLLFGGNAVWEYQKRQERLASEMSHKARQEQQVRDVLDNPEKHFPALWMTAPSAGDFINAVVPELLRQPLAANGWRMKQASCNGKSIRLHWEATPFAEYGQLPFNAVLDADPASARSTVSMPNTSTVHDTAVKRTQDSLLPSEQAVRALYAFTRRFELRQKVSFRKRLERTIAKQKVACPWISANVELTGLPSYLLVDHQALAKALDVPGLVLSELSYANGKWNLKGELYAR